MMLKCPRSKCGYEWEPKGKTPKKCPGCKNPYDPIKARVKEAVEGAGSEPAQAMTFTQIDPPMGITAPEQEEKVEFPPFNPGTAEPGAIGTPAPLGAPLQPISALVSARKTGESVGKAVVGVVLMMTKEKATDEEKAPVIEAFGDIAERHPEWIKGWVADLASFMIVGAFIFSKFAGSAEKRKAANPVKRATEDVMKK